MAQCDAAAASAKRADVAEAGASQQRNALVEVIAQLEDLRRRQSVSEAARCDLQMEVADLKKRQSVSEAARYAPM